MTTRLVLALAFLFVLSTFRTRVPELKTEEYISFNAPALVFSSLGGIQDQIKAQSEQKNFLDPGIEAESIFVFDLKENQVLYEKNAYEKKPLASLTKLMTALLLEERVPDGVFVPISLGAIKQEGDYGFLAGEKFKKENLRDFMLVTSSNDAAYAIAEFIGEGLAGEGSAVSRFAALMNERAAELGMKNSVFVTPNGLDIGDPGEKSPGSEGTASDVASLLNYIFDNYFHVITATRDDKITIFSENGRAVSGNNTNRALGNIPQLIGSKTGFTELAGGNLVFIFDAGFAHPVLVSIINSSEAGRFEDAEKITREIFKYFKAGNK